MKRKKKLIFVLALFTVLWNSCHDELHHSHSKEHIQEAEDYAMSLDAAKKYYSNISLLQLPQTQEKVRNHEENDSVHAANGEEHVHTDSCHHHHKHSTRSLPDISKSNIVPLWDEVREWSDSVFKYIEIPLNISGGKLYAHKTMKRKGEKTIFERVKPECMLVFEQRHGHKKIRAYIVTMIGEKKYLKKHGKGLKKMHHIPDDHAFTGVWYKSYLGGRIQSAYYYTEGKRTHKLFKASSWQQSEEMKDNNLLSVNLVDHSLFAPGYYTDWESDVYYCAFCGSYHTYDGDGCEVVIEWCSKCDKPIDDCLCCYYCGNFPCTCFVCSNCGNDPCTCYDCPDCGQYPCACCPRCDNYPCICCSDCGKYPCVCEEENPDPKPDPGNPDDCNGPKCPECGGLIVDDAATRASVSCPICYGVKCPVCGKKHCKEVHSKCDSIPTMDSIKSRTGKMYDIMKNTYPNGPDSYSFSDFENLLKTNGKNENSISLSYYTDENIYRLRGLEIGSSPTRIIISMHKSTVATIHNHPNGTPPSGIDFLNTAKWAEDSDIENYSTTYVYTTNGNYALYIEDTKKASEFYTKNKDAFSDTETKMFKENSDLDKKWNEIYKQLKDLPDTDRHMMSLVELAKQTDSGIRVLKSDALNKETFGLYYTQTIDNLIIPYNCK